MRFTRFAAFRDIVHDDFSVRIKHAWCPCWFATFAGMRRVRATLSSSLFGLWRVAALPFLCIIPIQSAHSFCFAEAAQKYEINELLLRAIAVHESGMRSNLVLPNTNGSFDIGLMGINTIHVGPGEKLSKAGMSGQSLLDPCTNVMTGAYLLRLKMERFGNTWKAVGAYHSVTEEYNARYQSRIWDAYQKLVSDAKHRAN